MTPGLHALRFDLAPNGATQVIYWPDRPAGRLCTIDPTGNLLDMRAGDQIFHDGKRRTVHGVRIYRADGVPIDMTAVGPVIECGREWHQALTVDPASRV